MCQSIGALRAVIVDLFGKPIEGATVLLTPIPATTAAFHGESSKDGILRISGLPKGDYLLIVTVQGFPQRALRITIIQDHEVNVGRIVIGNMDCFAPGTYCDSFGPPLFAPLPCLKNVDIVKEMPGPQLYLNHSELEQRAVRKVFPKWPPNTPQGYCINVAIMIDKNGKVLCAGLDGEFKEGISADAILAAARRWRFKPITRDDGQVVGALGRLLFITPTKSEK
jgi:hypothetical protein